MTEPITEMSDALDDALGAYRRLVEQIDGYEEKVAALELDAARTRQALRDMVNACKHNCTAQSYCGICKIALEVLVEVD